MRVLFAFLLILILAGSVQAKENVGVVSYNLAFPLSDMNDYVDEMSWRGFSFETRRFLAPKFSVGLSGGLNAFHYNTRELLSLEIGDVPGHLSGNQYRTAYSVPLLAGAHYYFRTLRDNNGVVPFVGLRLGTYYFNRRLEAGVVQVKSDDWHFGLSPEAGFVLPYRWDAGVFLNVKYNHIFGVTDESDYSYIDVSIGVTYNK